MKRWLRCCVFMKSDENRQGKIHHEASHTSNISKSASVCPEHSFVENPKDIQRKLDIVKKEFERTEKYRNLRLPAKRETVIGMESIPIYKESDGKLVSSGTTKTIVYTDN